MIRCAHKDFELTTAPAGTEASSAADCYCRKCGQFFRVTFAGSQVATIIPIDPAFRALTQRGTTWTNHPTHRP